MFDFLHHSAPHYPSIQEALTSAGVPSTPGAAPFTVLKKQGSYAGRHVNFFRAYDPATASARHIVVQSFGDLDAHYDLVLGSGHVEREGLVMVNSRPELEQEHATPSRAPADRRVHTDDERFVNRAAELAKVAAAKALI